MGDYFLDLRPSAERTAPPIEDMRFFPDMKIDRVTRDTFDLAISRIGDADFWSPYEAPDGRIFALAGRIALDDADWEAAESIQGNGGLACKAICRIFDSSGIDGIAGLSGGYAVHIIDPQQRTYSLILDPTGLYPGFMPATDELLLLSSHADILATAMSTRGDIDPTSLAEFLAHGQVGHPYTYYRGIHALEWGSCYRFELKEGRWRLAEVSQLAPRSYSKAPDEDPAILATEIAAGIGRAARMATSPHLGNTYVALSGGLDSRMLLSRAYRHPALRAFSIRGATRANNDFRAASRIADALEVSFMPLIRGGEHYASHAEMGVRIAGGMGSLSSNHFLGFRDTLIAEGYENLVTGCYFDYLFKSLALDTRKSPLLRQEKLKDYSSSSYLTHFSIGADVLPSVLQRQDEAFPPSLTRYTEPTDRLEVAARRTFPLWREGDNIQRLVAQRVFDWLAPAAFAPVQDIFWRIPIAEKLGGRLYRRAVMQSLPTAVLKVPDANIGVPIDAGALRRTIASYRTGLRRRLDRKRHAEDTGASWINWGHYFSTSDKIDELWNRSAPNARETIRLISGKPFDRKPKSYVAVSPEYFSRLLTLKLWLEQNGN